MNRLQTRDLIALLETYKQDFPSRWKEMLRSELVASSRLLDGCFTKDKNGNGWYVPHPREPGEDFDTALCLLNLLSPLMADRQTILRKASIASEKACLVAKLPYE